MTSEDWQEDPIHSAAIAAYEQAARRDPRTATYGYLAGDPATGAIAPFLWFASLVGSPGTELEFAL